MKLDSKEYYTIAINKVTNHIENNISAPLYLFDLAELSNLSPFHFHKIFKSITGGNLNEYVIRIRLEKAANLLIKTKCKIETIATDCGYSNQESFSRAFVKQFNNTPSKYRKENDVINRKINLNSSKIKSQLNIKPTIKVSIPIHIAYVRHVGSYKKVGMAWSEILKWKEKNIKDKEIELIGISHDNPEITDILNIRYDACVTISKPIKPINKIGYKILQGGKYAIFKYDSSSNSVTEIYDFIYSTWLMENNYQLRDTPSFEVYSNIQKSKINAIYIPIK